MHDDNAVIMMHIVNKKKIIMVKTWGWSHQPIQSNSWKTDFFCLFYLLFSWCMLSKVFVSSCLVFCLLLVGICFLLLIFVSLLFFSEKTSPNSFGTNHVRIRTAVRWRFSFRVRARSLISCYVNGSYSSSLHLSVLLLICNYQVWINYN